MKTLSFYNKTMAERKTIGARLSRYALIGTWATVAVMAVIALFALMLALSIAKLPLTKSYTLFVYGSAEVGATWPEAVASDVLPLLFLLYGLWHLLGLFRFFRKGRLFDRDNSRHLRAFAAALFLCSLFQVVAGPLAELLNHYIHFRKAIQVEIDTSQVTTGLLAGVLWLVALLLAEASRLQEDNEQIV